MTALLTVWQKLKLTPNAYTHTRTLIYIYIFMFIYLCVCVFCFYMYEAPRLLRPSPFLRCAAGGPWPETGEIDIMEVSGCVAGKVSGAVHMGRAPRHSQTRKGETEAEVMGWGIQTPRCHRSKDETNCLGHPNVDWHPYNYICAWCMLPYELKSC